MAKQAILWASPEVLMEICKYGSKLFTVTCDGLPEDAKFLHAWFDFEKQQVAIVVQSESFADMPEGSMLPYLPRPLFTVDYEAERFARLGAAVEAMPQGVDLARHGALGATKWCVTNTEDEHDSVDGDDAMQALQNAETTGFLARFRETK